MIDRERWERGMAGAVFRDLFRLLAACQPPPRRYVVCIPSSYLGVRPRKEPLFSPCSTR